MEVEAPQTEEGDTIVTIGKKEIDDLADPILNKANKLTRSILDLGYTLREAQYNMRDDFRQPPHAFDSDAPKQPSVED